MRKINKGGKCICGCIFEYGTKDITQTYVPAMGLVLDEVKCPECGMNIVVGAPTAIKENVSPDEFFPKNIRKSEPTTCSSYHIEYGEPRCWGTREKDLCSCDGCTEKCDFYPEKRKKEA